MTTIWYMVPKTWSATDRIFLSSWAIFCPFTLLTAQKIKISKNWRKKPGDIIIQHKCTKNHNPMYYCSWDMVHDRCNCYFSFWTIFCPFTHQTARQKEIKKKKKKSPGDIICIIYTTAPKIMIVCYTVPEICDWYNYFSFWVNYCPFTPNSPKNENSKKMKKTPVDIIMLKSVTKILITCYTVPEI